MNKLARFLEGISSLLCLYPNENRRKITLPRSSVFDALQKDWENVGLDMWKAYQEIEANHKDRHDRFDRSSRHHS